MLFIPKYIMRFLYLCRVKSFLSDCTVSVQSQKYLSIFQALNHFSPYKFLSLRSVDFFGEYLPICLFSANHQKRDLFHLHRQVLKLFRKFIHSFVHSPTMGYPTKRAVRKLIYYESIHESTSFLFVHVIACSCKSVVLFTCLF